MANKIIDISFFVVFVIIIFLYGSFPLRMISWSASIMVISLAVLFSLYRLKLDKTIFKVIGINSIWLVYALTLSFNALNMEIHLKAILEALMYVLVFSIILKFYVESQEKLFKLLIYSLMGFLSLAILMLLLEWSGLIMHGSAFSSLYSNPNTFAFMCLVYFAVVLNIPKRVQYKKTTFIILLTFFIILTGSTKGLIGLILIYMIYILNNYNFKKALIIIPIVTVLFSAGLLINGKAIDRANDKLNDFAGVSSGEYRADNIGHDSGKIRIFLALQAISVYMENKLTGVGVNNGQYYLELPDAFKSEMESINSQNNYTEMLLNVGILGFAMYYFPILYLLIRTMQSKGCHRHIRTLIISIIFLKIFMDVGMKSYNDAGHVFIVILAWYLYLTLLNTNKIIDR